MIQAQGRDEFCARCVDYLQTGALPDDPKQANCVVAHARNMGLTGQPGLLVNHWDTSGPFRRRVRRVQVVVPADQDIRKQLIAWAHSLGVGGHTGTTKTMATLRAHYWWRNQYKDVLEYVRSCERCQRQKNPAAHLRALPGPCKRPGPTAPGQEWHLDSTKVAKVDIMVYVDAFSRWPEVKIFEQPPTGRSMIEGLVEKVISRWGVPGKIHMDNISYNREKDFRAACERMGITCSYSTEYRSQANGLVESKMSVLKKLIRSVAFENPANWRTLMPLALLVYRCAVNKTTGLDPFYVKTGRRCVLPCVFNRAVENLLQEGEVETPNVYAASLVDRVKEAYRVARRNIARSKEHYNDEALLPVYFNEGDLVWIFTPRLIKSSANVFKDLWCGPFQITKRVNAVICEITSTTNPRDKRRTHVSRLKPKL
ncbi:unnamed protein product [Heterosigma akashiwo]